MYGCFALCKDMHKKTKTWSCGNICQAQGGHDFEPELPMLRWLLLDIECQCIIVNM